MKFNRAVVACTMPLAIVLNIPVPSSILNKKPSHAEFNLVVSPAKLSSLVSASLCAAPCEFSKAVVKVSILGALLAKVKRDLAPTTPTSSTAVFN